MNWKRMVLSLLLVGALLALPLSQAEARWRHGGPFFWPFWVGAAAVGTAAAIATAPLRAVGWPYYYPYYYAPPPAYYAPPAYYGAPYYYPPRY